MVINMCQSLGKKGNIDLPKCQDETVFHCFCCLVEEFAREEMGNRFFSIAEITVMKTTNICTCIITLHVTYTNHRSYKRQGNQMPLHNSTLCEKNNYMHRIFIFLNYIIYYFTFLQCSGQSVSVLLLFPNLVHPQGHIYMHMSGKAVRNEDWSDWKIQRKLRLRSMQTVPGSIHIHIHTLNADIVVMVNHRAVEQRKSAFS